MRSRYTAYATGAVSHLMATTAPESPHLQADARAWRADLAAYCAAVRFTGLTVHATSADGDTGRVRFTARFVHDGQERVIEEDSRFVRRGGRWLYLDAG
jgi:SEC-C motif-containing protein